MILIVNGKQEMNNLHNMNFIDEMLTSLMKLRNKVENI